MCWMTRLRRLNCAAEEFHLRSIRSIFHASDRRSEVDVRSASAMMTSQPEVVARLVLAAAMLSASVAGVLLDGSPNSHAQFPPWARRCSAASTSTSGQQVSKQI